MIPARSPRRKDIAETTHFLRRFAGLMANGQNAAYLHRTADLLEALAARVSASSDEEQLWRYKYETLSQQNDALERECEELRHDVERHVKLSSSIIAERDVHKTTLDAKEVGTARTRRDVEAGTGSVEAGTRGAEGGTAKAGDAIADACGSFGRAARCF